MLNITDEHYYLMAQKIFKLLDYTDVIDQSISVDTFTSPKEWYELRVEIGIKVNRKDKRFYDIHFLILGWMVSDNRGEEHRSNFVPLKLRTALLNLINDKQWKDKVVTTS